MREFQPHSEKQDGALFSDKRLTVAGTGIQWGKTLLGVIWLKMLIHTYTSPDDNFIITSPTFRVLEQSTLPPFLHWMQGFGRLQRGNMCFDVHNGGKVWIRTGQNPDSIVGITNVRGILCDEAGLYTRYFWEQIQGRSSIMRCPIMIVTSPYSLNWLYKDLIRPYRKDPLSRPNMHLIQATSRENPYFPDEEYDEKELTMDSRRFRMMYGGQFERMEGLVYDCFDERENQCDPTIEFPTDTVIVAGIDWGHTNPFVLHIRAITPGGGHYQVGEYVKARLTIKDIVRVCQQRMASWGISRFYCGPDRPENIVALNQGGCPASAADNSVLKGIDIHYELVKSRRFKMFRGHCPHSLEEYDTYHWANPLDLKPDQDEKEREPVKQGDHASEAARYVSVMTARGASKLVPKNPEATRRSEDHWKEMKRLKKKRKEYEEIWT